MNAGRARSRFYCIIFVCKLIKALDFDFICQLNWWNRDGDPFNCLIQTTPYAPAA